MSNGAVMKSGAHLQRNRNRLCGSTALYSLMRTVPAALLALLFTGEANAQAVNWLGGNGNWTEAAKWSSGAVPNGVFPDPAVATPSVIGTNAAGTVTINSAATARNIQVGNGSTLQVIGGGVLTTTPSPTSNGINTVGLASIGTAAATMLVDGAGSIWNAGAAGVRVGNGAAGTLTISNGGALNMQDGLLSVGLNAGGNGTLNINGGTVGSATVNNPLAALRVGYNGATGTVNITNGGTLTTTNLQNIGQTDTAGAGTATVNISGAGSTWTIAAGPDAGHSGNLVVGNGAGAHGTITISDGGKLSYSSLVNGPALIGHGGTGTVTVTGVGSIFESVKGATVGNAAGSTGTLTVTNGAAATFTTNNLIVGYQGGTGTLNISNGGTVTSAISVFVGNTAGSNGTLNINGGGQLNITNGWLEVGAQGNATATIDGQGSQVNANGFVVGTVQTGTATLSNGAVVNSGTFATIGQAAGTGTLNITSGGKLITGSVISVGWDRGNGTLNVTGAGSRIESNKIEMGIDTGSGAATGTITIADGAVMKSPEIIIGYNTGGNGTLNIGTGGAAGTVDGAIQMSGASSTINFNHNQANYTFVSTIGDSTLGGGAPVSGSVNFIGTGTTTLTAVNTYSLPTNVNAGQLVIAEGASIANSSLTTVNSGAALSGAGAVGNVLVKSGATIMPTNLRTLTVKNVTFDAGSIYQVGINSSGANSKIVADAATLNGGVVKISAGSGNYAAGARYTILTTNGVSGTQNVNGSVSGRFSNSVTSDLTFLNPSLDYSATQVDLTLTRNATSFASVAITPNQAAVASALDRLPASNGVYAAVVQQNASGAVTAYNALSGEAQASNQTALVTGSLIVGNVVAGRVAQGFNAIGATGGNAPLVNSFAAEEDDSYAMSYTAKKKAGPNWPINKAKPSAVTPPAVVYAQRVQTFGAWTNRNGDTNTAGYKSNTGGIMTGFDATFGGAYRLGVAAGYTRTNTHVDDRSSASNTDGYHVSVYGGAWQGPWGVQAGLTYSWNDVSSSRTVAFPGFSESLNGSYNARTLQGFGELNYSYLLGTTTLQPFAGLNYINHHTDGFSETGGISALTFASNDRNIGFTTTGMRAALPLVAPTAGNGVAVLGRSTLAWRHAFGDTDTASLASIAGSSFTVSGAPIDKDSLLAEAGLDFAVNADLMLGVTYAGQYGDDAREHQLRGQLRYQW